MSKVITEKGAVSKINEVTTISEVFHTNMHAGNINLSGSEGGKMPMKIAEELLEGQNIRVSLAIGLKVRDMLNKNRSKFVWGPSWTKIQDDDSDMKDVIKNCQSEKKESVLHFNNTRLSGENSDDPLTSRIAPELDLVNNEVDKMVFFKRAKS